VSDLISGMARTLGHVVMAKSMSDAVPGPAYLIRFPNSYRKYLFDSIQPEKATFICLMWLHCKWHGQTLGHVADGQINVQMQCPDMIT